MAQAAEAARYRALFSVAQRAALVVTDDGTVLEANGVFMQASGYPLASVTGAPYSDFWDEADVDLVEQEVRAAMSPAAKPTKAEHRFVTSDGARLWATVTTVPILTGPNAGCQVIVLLEDLSEEEAG